MALFEVGVSSQNARCKAIKVTSWIPKSASLIHVTGRGAMISNQEVFNRPAIFYAGLAPTISACSTGADGTPQPMNLQGWNQATDWIAS